MSSVFLKTKLYQVQGLELSVWSLWRSISDSNFSISFISEREDEVGTVVEDPSEEIFMCFSSTPKKKILRL